MSRRTDLAAPAAVIGIVVAVVAMIGGVTLAVVPLGGGSASGAEGAGPVPAPGSPYEPAPADTYPTEDPTALPTEDPTPTDDPLAGYQPVTAPGGLTVHVPATWPVAPLPDSPNYQADDPDADCLLRFGGSTADDRPLTEVVASFETGTPAIRKDYHRLKRSRIAYGQAEDAVDWEFTFTKGAGPRHAWGRYWRTGGVDYVAYGSCSAAAWPQLAQPLAVLFDTADPQ